MLIWNIQKAMVVCWFSNTTNLIHSNNVYDCFAIMLLGVTLQGGKNNCDILWQYCVWEYVHSIVTFYRRLSCTLYSYAHTPSMEY
jgi:hypothetical protein